MDRLTILAKALQQVRVVYIQSKAIGEEIAVVLDEDVGKVQVDDGVVVYAFSEIQKIIKGRISDEEIRKIHQAKKLARGKEEKAGASSKTWTTVHSFLVKRAKENADLVTKYRDQLSFEQPTYPEESNKPPDITSKRVSTSNQAKKIINLFDSKAMSTPPKRRPNPHALAWVEEHLDELLKLGWTENELFEPGKFKYPVGDWGLIFNSWPSDPELRDDGTITFRIPDLRRGYVEQKVYPKIYFKKAS